MEEKKKFGGGIRKIGQADTDARAYFSKKSSGVTKSTASDAARRAASSAATGCTAMKRRKVSMRRKAQPQNHCASCWSWQLSAHAAAIDEEGAVRDSCGGGGA